MGRAKTRIVSNTGLIDNKYLAVASFSRKPLLHPSRVVYWLTASLVKV